MDRDEAEKLMRKQGLSELEIARQLGKPCAAPYISKADVKPKGASRRNSYNAQKTWSTIWERTFRSGAERKFADGLLYARFQAGEISEVAFEPLVRLPLKVWGNAHIGMKPDFRYVEDGRVIHHEFKGFADERFKLQSALWSLVGPTEYRITWAAKKRYKYACGAHEIIYPKGMERP